MSAALRDFLKGSFALIALFLVLSHSGGFARAFGAGGRTFSGVFKTLQGR